MKSNKENCIALAMAALISILLWSGTVACGQDTCKNYWQHLDLKKDGFFGISSERAYQTLLKGKTGIPVVVAIIDGGVDTGHRDLKGVLWRNKKEIPDNGKDDDHNGYIDDINGWNFLGSVKGSFQYDNSDMVRQLRRARKEGKVDEVNRLQLALDKRRREIRGVLVSSKKELELITLIVSGIGKNSPGLQDFRKYRYRNLEEEKLLLKIVANFKQPGDFDRYRSYLETQYEQAIEQLRYWENEDYDPRKAKSFRKPFYGNADVKGPQAFHATHVAGLIGANNNTEELQIGVARTAELMVLRVVPTGDFLDSEMASAIRYAADNGARVINISAGKSGSGDPALLDSAVRYAMEKDVLIVHASGNAGKALEKSASYPMRYYSSGEHANAWIEVGASGPKDDASLLYAMTNYGRMAVDVFAPGVELYSCAPENRYAAYSGTSMATPIVTGIAAVLRSYYPELNAVEICEIIKQSVSKVDHAVKVPRGAMLPFREVCSSGGIVNLYNAVQAAERKIKNYKATRKEDVKVGK
jgi:subtilisin family serine protease